MGKKFDALKIEFNKLSLKVDLLNEYVTEKLGFDEDTEKVKCKSNYDRKNFFTERECDIIDGNRDRINSYVKKAKDILNHKPKFEALPEGVKFFNILRYNEDRIFYAFGDNQLLFFEISYYTVTHNSDGCFTDVSLKCHLEPCKIEDLRAGDWFITDKYVRLFIGASNYFTVLNDGSVVYCTHVWNEIKKIVYTP